MLLLPSSCSVVQCQNSKPPDTLLLLHPSSSSPPPPPPLSGSQFSPTWSSGIWMLEQDQRARAGRPPTGRPGREVIPGWGPSSPRFTEVIPNSRCSCCSPSTNTHKQTTKNKQGTSTACVLISCLGYHVVYVPWLTVLSSLVISHLFDVSPLP